MIGRIGFFFSPTPIYPKIGAMRSVDGRWWNGWIYRFNLVVRVAAAVLLLAAVDSRADDAATSNVLKGPAGNVIACRLKDPTGQLPGAQCQNAGAGYSLQWGFLPEAAKGTGASYLFAIGVIGMTEASFVGDRAGGAVSAGVLVSPLPGIMVMGAPVTFSGLCMVDVLAYLNGRWTGLVVLYVRPYSVTTGIAATIHIW